MFVFFISKNRVIFLFFPNKNTINAVENISFPKKLNSAQIYSPHVDPKLCGNVV